MFGRRNLSISARVSLAMALLVSMITAMPTFADQVDTTILASVDSNEVQAYRSDQAAISDGGRYVVFRTYATLVEGDVNGASDIFMRDTVTGITTIVSVSSDGTFADGDSFNPHISPDGRFVVFESIANNLTTGPQNNDWDIFIRDTVAGTTRLVSVRSGMQTQGFSYEPSVSSDGRYVAFYSAADVVNGDLNGHFDVFVRDTVMNTTQIVSVSSSEEQGNSFSQAPSISPDGRYVAFQSDASNLVSDDSGNHQDIFLRDLQAGTTVRISVNSDEDEANAISGSPSVSEGGRYVAFASWASNLTFGDTNLQSDVFVRDVLAGITTRVSVHTNSTQGNQASEDPSISADGRHITFTSWATNLVSGDTNNQPDIFMSDTQMANTTLVSVDSSGIQGNLGSWDQSISSDSMSVAFTSWSTNLVPEDTNDSYDVFVHYVSNTPPPPNTTFYVKWDAIGANNGTSWANAYRDLQSAFSAASAGDVIWVAAGTYKPSGGADRTISFALKNGVAVYGGFGGTEALLTQRDVAAYTTILSGDIGSVGDSSDNSYHVVVGSNTNNTAILDGFTIAAGNAYEGGGMYNGNGSPTLNNLIFNNNSAEWGGGMYNYYSEPILTNISFNNNSGGSGSGMFNYSSSPDMLNVTFSNNSGVEGSRGGAMVNDFNSSPNVTNATFVNNSVDLIGAGMLNSDNSNSSLVNVTFVGNSAGDRGGAIYNWDSNPNLNNVTFNGNSASTGGAIYNDNDSNPIIVNSIMYGNIGGEIHNEVGTATVTYSIVEGGYPGTGNLDVDPLLVPLADNGGFTQTMALQSGSPAIDAANDAFCPPTDQRGVTRPQGSHCDIGAYEFEGLILTPTFTPLPTNTATNTPTFTPTRTPTNTPKAQPTNTLTSTPITPTATQTLTPHPPTVTFTPSPTTTATNVVSDSAELVKSFSPLTITSGGISRLNVMIFNLNSFPLTEASLVDSLPSGMTIANPVNATNLCGGTVTAVSGGTSLSLSGGTVQAQGSCTVAIDVTSSTLGNVTNTIPAGALTTENGVTNANSTSATLTVLPSIATNTATSVSPTPTRTPKAQGTNTLTSTPITPTATHTVTPSSTTTATNVVSVPAELNKSFSPTSIAADGISRLGVTIFNPNPFALTNVSLTDNLPAGITIANPVNLSNSCGGTVTAVSGGANLSLVDGSVPARVGSTPGSCTVAIDVTSSTAGNLVNTIPAGALSTANNVTNTSPASATLNVIASTATNTATTPPPTATRTPKTQRTNTPTVGPSSTPTFTLSPTNTALPPTATFTATSTHTATASTTPGSSGFPSTGVLDTFNRANGGIGTNWSGYVTAFTISSNQLDVVSSGVNTYIFWKNASFGADQEVHFNLTQIDSGPGNEQSLILKSQSSKSSSSGLISVRYDGAGQTVQVWTYHPTQGWVQHGANIPMTFVNGDQFGAHARSDGTVEIYRNGVLVGTRSITSWPYYSNDGYVGLWLVNSPNAVLDDFGGGTASP